MKTIPPVSKCIFFRPGSGRNLLLLFSMILGACAQLKPLPPLPPTVALASTQRIATLSLMPTQTQGGVVLRVTPKLTGLDDTLAPDQPTLSDDEIVQTRTALAALYSVQTQFAILQGPSVTPTPCPTPPCRSPTPTWSPPRTKTPTLTPTATAQLSDQHIISPGPMSKVVSPIHLIATGSTGAAGMIRVELYAEDGRLMMRQILKYGSMLGSSFILNLDIPFEISVVAESARLVVSVDDAKNRPIALTSSDLILLTMGDAQINPSEDNLASIIINQPAEAGTLTSGFMEVKGQVRAITDQPLLIEVYTDEGALVGTRQATVVTPPDGAYHPFEAIVPYTVSQSKGARLIVRQESNKIPGNVALSSVSLTLKP